MSLTKYFVTNNNIPEFIKSDSVLFEAFVEAYYEWIELQNDSESLSYADVYKAVGNPGHIVNKNNIIVDIDETIDQFVDFFATEVVPISVEGMKSNPRFFIKKIRELYLAKGTPKSFKLFFKLYYNDDIDVFETRDTVLRASDGKYFSFPTSHFLVNKYEENVSLIDFTLAKLQDSDGVDVATVLSGLTIDKLNGFSIIKAELSNEVELDTKQNYSIVGLDDSTIEIGVSPLYTISNINISDGGSLFNTNDRFSVTSKSTNNQFFGTIDSAQGGYVDGIITRGRGFGYKTTDSFELKTSSGPIGSFVPSKVTSYGEIEEIDGIPLRTGIANTGFNSTNFVDVQVPISNTVLISELPKIVYIPSVDSQSILGEPYVDISGHGSGFQAIAYSNSLGKATAASLNQIPYFLNDSDVEISEVSSVLVENATMKAGDKISFQLFVNSPSASGFDDDFEIYKIFYHVHKIWEHDDLTDSSIITEVNIQSNPSFPVSWDSELADWVTYSPLIQTIDANPLQPIIDMLDSDSNISNAVMYTDVITTGIDGGEWAITTSYDSDLDGGSYESGYDPFRWVDGGDSYDFAKSELHIIGVEFNGQYMDYLESQHWDRVDSDYNFYTNQESLTVERRKRSIDLESYNRVLDIGYWGDLGHYGVVQSIDSTGTVAKVVPIPGSTIPNDLEWAKYTEDKYAIVLATPFDETGYAPTNNGLPLENVVHRVSTLKLDYTLGTVTALNKKFWTQDGFISSSYGGTIQDNYYYSDYSYRIKSTIPFYDWKQKFKTLLHPAGLVLSGELVLNSEASFVSNPSASAYSSDNSSSAMTFDMMQENVNMLSSNNVNADNTFYKTNPFEYGDTSVILDTSTQTSPISPFIKMQSGNAWWDYEPAGWVNETVLGVTVTGTYQNLVPATEFKNKSSTQDRDPDTNNLHVANNYHWYGRFQSNYNDFYKTHKRIDLNQIRVAKTQFEDSFITYYTAFDSELPLGHISTFGDSNASFKAIDYTIFKHSDSDYFPTYSIPRSQEIKAKMGRDFLTAMKESNLLTWISEGKTYYDYEAYDKKWNGVTPERTYNNEGFVQKLHSSYYEYVINTRSNIRSKSYDIRTIIDENLYKDSIPYNKDTWNVGDLLWDVNPIDDINTIKPTVQPNTETYLDPQISMRGRRGS